MIKKWSTTVFFLYVILHGNTFLFASGSEQAKEVLNKYESYLKKLNSISFSSTEKQKDIGNKTEDNSLKCEWVIGFEEKKAWKKTILDDTLQSQLVFPTYYREISIIPISTITVSHGKYQDGEEWLIVNYVSPPNKFWKEIALGVKNYPFGLINDEQSENSITLVPMMRNGNLEIVIPEDDEEKLVRLMSTSTKYVISLCLDITKGFAPVKIEINQKHIPKGMPNRLEFAEYIVTDFQEIDGFWLPKTYTVREVRSEGEYSLKPPEGFAVEFPHGEVVQVPKEERLVNVTISNVAIKENLPDNEFFIRSKIPNGTPVTIRDAPQIQYIWFDGKIVPKTDELMLRIARGGHKFMPGPSESRFWMMGIGISLIVFALSVKAYKMYKGIDT